MKRTVVQEEVRKMHMKAGRDAGFMAEEKGTASSFQGMREPIDAHGIIETHGLPSSFYRDRSSLCWHTPEVGGEVDNPIRFPMKKPG
ncbi:MAG: hypothetical protein LBB76_00385 [Azoarcus sp.]|nr:hypothetical protein [Azoarcus sp.]